MNWIDPQPVGAGPRTCPEQTQPRQPQPRQPQPGKPQPRQPQPRQPQPGQPQPGKPQPGQPQPGQPQQPGKPQPGQPQPGQPQPGQPRSGQPGQPPVVAPTGRMSLSDVVHRFKLMTTKQYTDGVKQSGWAPYNGRVWQRNYYEHIIRNEKSLLRIRDYIDANPSKWDVDPENPSVIDRNVRP